MRGNPHGRGSGHKLYEYADPRDDSRYVAVGVGDALPGDLVRWMASLRAEGVEPRPVAGTMPTSFLGAIAALWIARQRWAELGHPGRVVIRPRYNRA